MKYHLSFINVLGGVESNKKKISNILEKQIRDDLTNPRNAYGIRNVALRITSKCPEKDYLCEVKKLLKFVQRFRYAKDFEGVELFESPYIILRRALANKKYAQGDCETLAQLFVALCRSMGHKASVYLVDTTGDGEINHAIARVRPYGSVKAMWAELTKPWELGRAPKIYRAYKVKMR